MSHEEGEVTYPTLQTLMAGTYEPWPLTPNTQIKGRYIGTDTTNPSEPVVYIVSTHLDVYKIINSELVASFKDADSQDCRVKITASGSFSVVLYGS